MEEALVFYEIQVMLDSPFFPLPCLAALAEPSEVAEPPAQSLVVIFTGAGATHVP